MENKEGMATQTSILTWRIPWTEEPDEFLRSMGSQRVGQHWRHLKHTGKTRDDYIRNVASA